MKLNINDENVLARLNSYQFKLSQKIFGKRIALNISRDEAAKLTKLTLEKYTKIEQGIDLNSSEKFYLNVLDNLNNFQNNKEIKLSNKIQITESVNNLKKRTASNINTVEYSINNCLIGESI